MLLFFFNDTATTEIYTLSLHDALPISMVLWSRHSDRTGERRWHLALPAALGGVTIPVALYLDSPFTVMAVITLTAVGICCALPVFWHFPPLLLTGAGAAAGIALINSLGNTAGFAAPYITEIGRAHV